MSSEIQDIVGCLNEPPFSMSMRLVRAFARRGLAAWLEPLPRR